MHYIKSSIYAFLFLSCATGTHADVITHFEGGYGSDIPVLLTEVGINNRLNYTETIYEAFVIPDNTQSLAFNFIRDTGSYLFTFGMFYITETTADPTDNPLDFAVQAITNSIVIFDDRTSDPGSRFVMNQPQSGKVGFYIIPNDTVATFLGDPERFYDGARPVPLFTMAAANPGGFDQAMSFTDVQEGITLFSFEDLTRTGSSDNDFIDMSFTVTPGLLPTPSPWQEQNNVVDPSFRPQPIPSQPASFAGIILSLSMLYGPSRGGWKARHNATSS